HGYLKSGTAMMLRFRAAYVSGPYRPPGITQANPAVVHRQIAPYTVRRVPVAELPPEPVVEQVPETGKQTTMLDVIVGRLRGKGPPAHRVWRPPLDEPPSLDELLAGLAVDERLGLHAPGPLRGRLSAPVGVVDRPFEQRRDPMMVELDGGAG